MLVEFCKLVMPLCCSNTSSKTFKHIKAIRNKLTLEKVYSNNTRIRTNRHHGILIWERMKVWFMSLMTRNRFSVRCACLLLKMVTKLRSYHATDITCFIPNVLPPWYDRELLISINIKRGAHFVALTLSPILNSNNSYEKNKKIILNNEIYE